MDENEEVVIKTVEEVENQKLKDKLDKAEKANQELVAKLLSDPTPVAKVEVAPPRPIDEIIKEHNNFSGTNREYAKLTCEAFDQLITNDLAMNKFSPEIQDNMRKTHEGFKYMLANSTTNQEFIELFKELVTDSHPVMSTKINKAGGLLNYLAK